MDIPSKDELVAAIRAFLARHDMAPSAFGRAVNGEGQLLDSIESGRSPSLNLLRRITGFMAESDATAGFTLTEEVVALKEELAALRARIDAAIAEEAEKARAA